MTQSAYSATSDQVDQRRYPRFELSVPVILRRTKAGSWDVVMPCMSVEISEGGLSLISSGQLPIGEEVEVEFRLPFGTVTARGMIRNQMAFRCGLEFTALDSAVCEKIKSFCETLPRYVGGSSQY